MSTRTTTEKQLDTLSWVIVLMAAVTVILGILDFRLVTTCFSIVTLIFCAISFFLRLKAPSNDSVDELYSSIDWVEITTIPGRPIIAVYLVEPSQIDERVKQKFGTQKNGLPHRWQSANLK